VEEKEKRRKEKIDKTMENALITRLQEFVLHIYDPI